MLTLLNVMRRSRDQSPEPFHVHWSVTALRYYNSVGPHESGEISEDPAGVPGNVPPFLIQLAAGRHEELKIFGPGYPTPASRLGAAKVGNVK
jgi:UDP-glucose 4-epimerase